MRGLVQTLDAAEERSAWDDTGSRWFNPMRTPYDVTQDTAFNLSAVWACQTLIADAIATLPVGTFRNANETRTPTTAPRWVDNPNPESNRIDYETQRVLSLLGWGNAYTYLLREANSSDPQAPVLERWLLNPASVQVRRDRTYDERSPIKYWLRGQEIPLGNIQHIRGYVPPGRVLGMSIIDQASRGLEMTVAAEEAGSSLYNNGMLQAGVASIPQMPAEVSKDVAERIADQIVSQNGGARNAGKPLILFGGTTWQGTMFSPSDAQYLETRKFQINEICRWFRVPPHKIADIVAHASQGGGMGIEQQATEFAQDTLLPWVRRLEAADSALIPRGQYVRYNLNAYVRADLATRYEAYTQARLGGWMSANDVLRLEDSPPIEHGDIYLQPLNYIEAGTDPAVTQPSVSMQGAPDGSQ